jgi:hypothetical protein
LNSRAHRRPRRISTWKGTGPERYAPMGGFFTITVGNPAIGDSDI